jgi:septal ring factor EnvC (AmiA/AmiB activator)
LYFEEKVMRVEEEFRDQVSRLEMRCRLSASEKEELEDKIEEQEKERKDREKKINQVRPDHMTITCKSHDLSSVTWETY